MQFNIQTVNQIVDGPTEALRRLPIKARKIRNFKIQISKDSLRSITKKLIGVEGQTLITTNTKTMTMMTIPCVRKSPKQEIDTTALDIKGHRIVTKDLGTTAPFSPITDWLIIKRD